MRIIFPTLARYPTNEAPAVQVANMAQAFAELGHDVRLVVPAGPAASPDASPGSGRSMASPTHDLGFKPAFRVTTLSSRIHRGQSYLHAARIARIAAPGRVDLVFSRNLRACVIPALRGVPTVIEAHTLNSFTGVQERWAMRRLQDAPGFRGVVAISQGLADDLVTALGLPRDRVLVAHDAVREDTVVPAAATRATAVESASWASGVRRLRVGYTGSLFAGRGVELLTALARRCDWLTLDLVGGPPDAARALAADIARTDARDRVVVHGPVSPVRARELQREVDVLVAPFGRRVATDSGVDSSRWMSPMKVFEYMASGRPIVISDLPVLREVLRPDVDALMVPPDDLVALETAVRQLAEDPALGARLAASARARVLERFTWAARAQRILERFAPSAG